MNPLLLALSTLTLLPVSPKQWRPSEVRLSAAFYPLVGALLGALFALASKVQLAHDLRTILVLLAWVLATGAFHLDGLSDCLDGFFGGRDPKDRRRIMKDPSVGAYGVTGIVLVLVLKAMLLSRLLSEPGDWKYLILIPWAARWGVTLACTFFRSPPGDKGLGSQVLGLEGYGLAIPTFVSLAGGWWLLRAPSLGYFLAAGLVAMAVGLLSRARIQGLTGDGMGAIIETSEVALLFLACANFSKGWMPF
ncbi:MAG TPA: adenosylcobinamide-GDP ribazoletransferase [bacterium]|nr:adenosylcobinamide-GDP ribazoletransferase [bacterium]